VWTNIYGPPLGVEGKQADFMTKYSDKGSIYRGRILWQIETYDQEGPKNQVKDLKFSLPFNASPNPKERGYLLRVELYEGIELPDTNDEYSVHITCGPYIVKSKVKKNDNSRTVWNQSLPHLSIRAPEYLTAIPDIFVYLSTSENDADRICFKRFK
jgi:hypothetical protein